MTIWGVPNSDSKFQELVIVELFLSITMCYDR